MISPSRDGTGLPGCAWLHDGVKSVAADRVDGQVTGEMPPGTWSSNDHRISAFVAVAVGFDDALTQRVWWNRWPN
jgi:hypothetical protein